MSFRCWQGGRRNSLRCHSHDHPVTGISWLHINYTLAWIFRGYCGRQTDTLGYSSIKNLIRKVRYLKLELDCQRHSRVNFKFYEKAGTAFSFIIVYLSFAPRLGVYVVANFNLIHQAGRKCENYGMLCVCM